LQVIGEFTDGPEAIQNAKELQPDLILLDVGPPTLNGIEAARHIRKVFPKTKILFVSENRSPEVAEEALNTGARGYVLKSDAASELLPAIKAVLAGKRFISASLAGHFLVATAVSATQTTLLTSMVMLISGIR
jgi:DNA-binding NarL/FixJ family response regulator